MGKPLDDQHIELIFPGLFIFPRASLFLEQNKLTQERLWSSLFGECVAVQQIKSVHWFRATDVVLIFSPLFSHVKK